MKKFDEVNRGNIILMNGLSGSGKTTLSLKLLDFLKEKGRKAYLIDGDMSRKFFDYDLDYSQESRFMYFKRNSFGAYLLSVNGVDVILAVNVNVGLLRDFIKSKTDFLEFFLDADINDCIKNDPKGVYKKNMHLKKPGIPGIDISFEKPDKPDLILYPYKETPEESFKKITGFLIKNKKI